MSASYRASAGVTTSLVGMCGIVILFRLGFYKKNSDSVRVSLVWFEKTWFHSDVVVIYYLYNTRVIYSKYYSITVLCCMNCGYHMLNSVSIVF